MIARGKFYPWERETDFDLGNWKLKTGDYIIADFSSNGESGEPEAVEILGLKEKSAGAKPIMRIGTLDDIESVARYRVKKEATLKFARSEARRYGLEIKFIDAQFSFDGSRLAFGFISSQRVDFRELVKSLSKHFQKSIKMIQVGSRDGARSFGGVGSCGRQLCCASFLDKIESVTLGDAKIQRLDTRGANRLSGVCSRLKCCLAYESKLYAELSRAMPAFGEDIETKRGRGKVADIYALARKVKVILPDNSYEILDVSEINWKK
jgi:cell fate regulator YaaT (PSP1 superfamily)